jgi:hypothetical protein
VSYFPDMSWCHCQLFEVIPEWPEIETEAQPVRHDTLPLISGTAVGWHAPAVGAIHEYRVFKALRRQQ